MAHGRRGLSRRLNGTFIMDTTNACHGGKSYTKEMREQVISLFQNGGWDAMKTAQLGLPSSDIKRNFHPSPPVSDRSGSGNSWAMFYQKCKRKRFRQERSWRQQLDQPHPINQVTSLSRQWIDILTSFTKMGFCYSFFTWKSIKTLRGQTIVSKPNIYQRLGIFFLDKTRGQLIFHHRNNINRAKLTTQKNQVLPPWLILTL